MGESPSMSPPVDRYNKDHFASLNSSFDEGEEFAEILAGGRELPLAPQLKDTKVSKESPKRNQKLLTQKGKRDTSIKQNQNQL